MRNYDIELDLKLDFDVWNATNDTNGSYYEFFNAFDFSKYRISIIKFGHSFEKWKRENIKNISYQRVVKKGCLLYKNYGLIHKNISLKNKNFKEYLIYA